MRAAGSALASILFPAPCRICDGTLDTGIWVPICRACLSSFSRYNGPMCAHCGRPFSSPVAAETPALALCHLCRRKLYDFDFARSYSLYLEAMAKAVILLKHHQVLPLGRWFAERLFEIVDQNRGEFVADVLVPVPLHRARRKERGYNHAELIGRPLARKLGLSFRPDLLVRTKPRPDKLRLTMRERWRTVRGAFAAPERARVDNLRVLLVDDVFTTGATLDACSRALRKAGVSRVAALTVARAVPPGAMPQAELPAKG